jgi:RNA polymerase sigma-70 factor, ECF subfamily
LRSDIAHYHDALIGIAYRITGDGETAKDVVQDTYIAVLKNEDAFKGFSSLKTYLYRIAINKSIDALRNKNRRWSLFETIREDYSDNRTCVDDKMDMKVIVRKLMNNITAEFRIPLILAEIDGMSYMEISETLGISINTVRTRIFRCREKMRKELHNLGVIS